MALSVGRILKFVFENSAGDRFSVKLDVLTGAGYARPLGGSIPNFDQTETALQVDAGSLSTLGAKHVSYLCHAAIFNTTKSLDTILTD